MVHLRFVNEEKDIQILEGVSLLEAEVSAGLIPDAPCGGRGRCGKCLVEIRRPGDGVWRQVKACETAAAEDLEVRTLTENARIQVLTEGVNSVSGEAWPWGDGYAAAFDLGTTSIAGYLLCRDGAEVRAGMLNPQSQYGADVITRADWALAHGTEALSGCVREALDGLLGDLCRDAGIQREQVKAVCIVGNTCMHHFLLNISPDPLVHAPYHPAVKEALLLEAADCGFHAHPDAKLFLPPVIAGFVGSDTVGCLLAGDWENKEVLTLLIDIGTNGELVLGTRRRMIACSTAAGPAFEGAKIQCGMRGAPGAVDHVSLEDGRIVWSVVGGGEAKGICGSGLIDLIAVLRKTGDIDESGRLTAGADYRLGDTAVVLTQKDVREVQLAKAAVAAGIRLMAGRLGVELEEICRVTVAGAFGSYMDADSACDIGLIPDELRGKICAVGNAAGEGAKQVIRRRDAWDRAQRLARQAEFLELASIPEFQDEFVNELEFPEL